MRQAETALQVKRKAREFRKASTKVNTQAQRQTERRNAKKGRQTERQ